MGKRSPEEKSRKKNATLQPYRPLWQEMVYFSNYYEGKVKSSRPSLRDTRDKRPLGRDPDRSWCHCYVSAKLSWSQAMHPWTERQHTHMLLLMSMDPWAETKKPLHLYGDDTKSCLGTYPTATCPKFHIGWRLGSNFSPCAYNLETSLQFTQHFFSFVFPIIVTDYTNDCFSAKCKIQVPLSNFW